MSQSPDEGMEDFMENSTYGRGNTLKGRNIRYRKVSPDPKRQRKLLLLGSAGILLLVAIVAISFRAGNRYSADALTSIQDRVDQLGERLTHIEGMDNRIVLLEKQEKGLQQSISELNGSGRSLREQLDKLTQKIDRLQKRMASVAAKTETSRVVQKKPISKAEMRYHKVRPGDTLYRIAKKYGISVDELRRLNNLTRNQFVHPGQKLLVAPGGRQ